MKLLYFSPVSWNWIRQRPHFLAEEFAGSGHEVCFFFYNAIGKTVCNTFQPFPRLTVREWAVLPGALRLPLIDHLNAFYLRSQIPWEEFDLVFFTSPRQILLWSPPKNFKGKVIYDCMDKTPDFFTGRQKLRLLRLERILCKKVDLIVVSTSRLKEYLVQEFSIDPQKVRIVRNAVRRDVATGSDIVSGEIVYIGTIDSWFDWGTLIAYAQTHPKRRITLIGPCKSKPQRIPDNIVLTGSIKHDLVGSHIRGASLLLIPFKVNSLIEFVDPVKLYEYLAWGKNVLSAYWQELDYFLPNPHLHFYHSSREFDDLAERLLSESSDTSCVPDLKFIQKNCWTARASEYEQILKELV